MHFYFPQLTKELFCKDAKKRNLINQCLTVLKNESCNLIIKPSSCKFLTQNQNF